MIGPDRIALWELSIHTWLNSETQNSRVADVHCSASVKALGIPGKQSGALKQFHLYTPQCRLPFLIEIADITDVSMSPDVP